MHDSPQRPPDEANPYASPKFEDEAPSFAAGSVTSMHYRRNLQAFRTHLYITGGIWIAYGCLCVLALLAVLSFAPDLLVTSIVVVVAALWLGLGIATCYKQMWAVYVGLVLSYLSVLSNLIRGNVCGLILLVPVIIFAHLAISKAGQLRRAGIPLTAKPGSLFAAKDNPFSSPNFDGIKFDD